MPTKSEKQEFSDSGTTGHEWDGIQEYNNPLPRWWLWVFYLCIGWSLVYWVLMPAWPGISGHSRGLLGYSQRAAVATQIAEARQRQGQWLDRIAAATPAEIVADPDLLTFAQAGGASAFGINCAPCHGGGAVGRPGYPNLNDDEWLWGGDLDTIERVIRHGVRSPTDAETLQSEMMPFADLLLPEQIEDLASHVLSLAGVAGDDAASQRGAALFAENCAVCHGETGAGLSELGAPALNNAIWLYGGDRETVIETVRNGRRGHMPAWSGRLDDATVKQLAVYVHSLGGGE